MIHKSNSNWIVRVEGHPCKSMAAKLDSIDVCSSGDSKKWMNGEDNEITANIESSQDVVMPHWRSIGPAVHSVYNRFLLRHRRDWLSLWIVPYLTFYHPNDVTAINFNCCSELIGAQIGAQSHMWFAPSTRNVRRNVTEAFSMWQMKLWMKSDDNRYENKMKSLCV